MDQPDETIFPASPATLVIHHRGGDETWIGAQIVHRPSEPDSPIYVVIRLRCDEKWFPCTTFEDSVPGRWTAQLLTDNDSDVALTVRATVEGDATDAITRVVWPGYPQPLEVIADTHPLDEQTFTMPQLYALSGDSGIVQTLMLTAGTGIYLRQNRAWVRLVDDDEVDGLTVNDLPGTGVTIYDRARGRIWIDQLLAQAEQAAIAPAGATR